MRSYGILPAAGHSLRMGQPKLLLPWETSTLVEHVLRVWQSSRVDVVVVVARGDDRQLLDVLSHYEVHTVCPPSAPAEMKHSVQYGLQYLRDQFAPADEDRWLLSPADTPMITASHINLVLDTACADPRSRIVIPVCNGRRGHPVAFPWPMASQVLALGDDEGVNAVVRRHAVLECRVPDAGILQDVDCPDEYHRLRGDATRPEP